MMSYEEVPPRASNKERRQPLKPARVTEAFAEKSEAARQNKLRDMRDRSEADFREGCTLTWEDVKVRYGL